MGDYGVITASANYRLGAWGFLSVADTPFTGNQGFRDQVLALKWVRDNAEAFGGDPDRIVIFGESAGSWSVAHLVLSPAAGGGLFRGAIGHSGTPVGRLANTYRTKEKGLECGTKLVEAVGCQGASNVTECLQEAPQATLAEVTYVPRGVVDGQLTTIDPFLPERPEVMLERGDFNRVPIIFGANSGEALYWIQDILRDPELLEAIDADWKDVYGPAYLFKSESNDLGDAAMSEVAMAARKHFFRPDSIIDLSRLDAFVKVVTDAWYQYGVHVWNDYVSAHVPAYQYMLSYQGSLSMLNQTKLPSEFIL